jgi:hypothetical protein
VGPISAITAVLYYFGFTREHALFGYFGIDVDTLGFSTADYLVRSAEVAFAPLAALLVLAAAALAAHPFLAAFLARLPNRALVGLVCATGAAAVALLGIALAALVSPTKTVGPWILAPAALGGAGLLSGYTFALTQRHLTIPDALRSALTSGQRVRTGTLVALTLVAIFWATANAGREQGTKDARTFELSLAVQHQAVVYSRQRLQIFGPGITSTELDPRNAAYVYRYSGLRLLAHSGGRWFLLPAGWRSDNGTLVTILDDSDTGIRVALAP